MEEGETLANAKHDEGQVEEDTPERRYVFRAEYREVGGDELRGESVDLVAGLADGVRPGGDDAHPGQVGDVVILGGRGRLQTSLLQHGPVKHVGVHLLFSVIQKLP